MFCYERRRFSWNIEYRNGGKWNELFENFSFSPKTYFIFYLIRCINWTWPHHWFDLNETTHHVKHGNISPCVNQYQKITNSCNLLDIGQNRTYIRRSENVLGIFKTSYVLYSSSEHQFASCVQRVKNFCRKKN